MTLEISGWFRDIEGKGEDAITNIRETIKGSHIILRRREPFAQLAAPDHKELDRGTLRAIVRQAGISVEKVTKLLQAPPLRLTTKTRHSLIC